MSKQRVTLLFTLGVLSLLLASLSAYLILRSKDEAVQPITPEFLASDTESLEIQTSSPEDRTGEEVRGNEPEPDLTLPAIDQAALLDFVVDYNQRHAGDLSLAIYDLSRRQQVINYQPDNLYFTGSIYKLYIAFLAWQDLDAGIFDPDEVFFAAHPLYGRLTLRDCLHYMIQKSDSGCAETFLGRYDRAEAQARLRQLGLPNVLVDGFYISAADSQALMLHIYENRDNALKEESQASLLKALQQQHYRKYVIAGFKSIATDSYNKTGDSWLPGQRIHNDLTILHLTDGRVLSLSLLTKEGGQHLIIDFAKKLADYLTEELSLSLVSG